MRLNLAAFVSGTFVCNSTNVFASYGYTWDAADRITDVDFLGDYADENVTYDYDDAGQVIGADRDGTGAVLDETYVYDDNGNRESVDRDGATTDWGVDTNNRVTTDGEYNYEFDDEGNLAARIKLDGMGDPTLERTEYTWDHRNRLLSMSEYNASDVLVRSVDYAFDGGNLLVAKDASDVSYETEYRWDGVQLQVDENEIHNGVNSWSHTLVYEGQKRVRTIILDVHLLMPLKFALCLDLYDRSTTG